MNSKKLTMAVSLATCLMLVLFTQAIVGRVQAADGKATVDAYCTSCHGTGIMDAPKIGDTSAWKKRLDKGYKQLVKNAIDGINTMPPRGGNPALTDKELDLAVSYLLQTAKLKTGSPPARATQAVAKTTPKTPPPPIFRSKANRFNRLMKPPSEWNPAPMKDGIHDPTNDGTVLLQPPKESFASLPKSTSGNRVDWAKSLDENHINPRYDRDDPTKEPLVMDLNIVREVKGTMPDVVYPHAQHTKWLDCSNCHPAIFIPQKGANQMSMASIMMGQQCGVCHGRVAFPIAECRRCHSKKKSTVSANK